MKELPLEIWKTVFSFFSTEEIKNIVAPSKMFEVIIENYYSKERLKNDFEINNVEINLKREYIKYYNRYKIIETLVFKNFPNLRETTLLPLPSRQILPANGIHYFNLLPLLSPKTKQSNPYKNKPFILAYMFTHFDDYSPNIKYVRKGEKFNSLLKKILNIVENNIIFGKDNYGKNALHYATHFGNHHATDAILEKATNKIAACFENDRDKKTPIIYAAESGDFETFKTILNYFDDKIEIFTQEIGDNETILLDHAIFGGNIKIVLLIINLIENKESVCLKAFSNAVNCGKSEIIEEILSYIPIPLKGEVCLKFFCDAAKSGSPEAIQSMLNFIENKEFACLRRDESGLTPLHYAAKNGNVEAINKILYHITDKKFICQENIPDNLATTYMNLLTKNVLCCAWESGNADAVKTILVYFDDKKSAWDIICRCSLGNSGKITNKEREEINNYVNHQQSTSYFVELQPIQLKQQTLQQHSYNQPLKVVHKPFQYTNNVCIFGNARNFFPESTPGLIPITQQQEKQNQLIDAILKNDIELVKTLESQGASFLYPNKDDMYPLVAAVYSVSLFMVKHVEEKLIKLNGDTLKQWEKIDIDWSVGQINGQMPQNLPVNVTCEDYKIWKDSNKNKCWMAQYNKEIIAEYNKLEDNLKKFSFSEEYARGNNGSTSKLGPLLCEAHGAVVKAIREQLNYLKEEVINKSGKQWIVTKTF